MASSAEHTKRAAIAMQDTCLRLGELFQCDPPAPPRATRYGQEHLTRVQWEFMRDWLMGKDAPVNAEESEVAIAVDFEDEPIAPVPLADAPSVTSFSDTAVVTITEDERLAAIVAPLLPPDVALPDVALPDVETVEDEPTEVEDTPDEGEYAGWTKRKLLDLAAERGVAVVGSGFRGYVRNEDIIEALQNAAPDS